MVPSLNESRLLHEFQINIPQNASVIDLLFSIDEVRDVSIVLLSSPLDWNSNVSIMFKMPSPRAKKKTAKITSHRLLTADEMFEQKMKEEEEKQRKLHEK